MARSTLLAISGLLGAGLFCSIGGCGSEEPEKAAAPTAGQAGSTVAPMPPNLGMAGRGPAGSGATVTPTPMAGAGGAGSGGSTTAMAGSGAQAAGHGGAAAGMGGAGGAAGSSTEDDPFGLNGLFGDPGALSCEGLLCLEAADCAALYPDETATCKFTKCEDFVCTK